MLILEVKRQNEELAVTFTVGAQRYTCPIKELTENSPYFSAMFTPNHEGFVETTQKTIKLEGVDPHAFRVIVKCLLGKNCLKGVLPIPSFSRSILQTAAMLQFEGIFERCVEISRATLSVDNCLIYLGVADELGAHRLYVDARYIALWRFIEVCECPTFVCLTLQELKKYLSSDLLRTPSEVRVMHAALLWLEESPEERKMHWVELLKCVRWKFMDCSDLMSLARNSRVTAQPQILTTIKSMLSLNTEWKSDPDNGQEILSNCSFDMEVLQLSKELLSTPERKAPQMACFVGHRQYKKDSEHMPDIKFGELVPTVGFLNADKMQLEVMMEITKLQTNEHECTGYSIVSVGKNIFILGGERLLGHSDWNHTVWCYDTHNNYWKAVGELPFSNRHMSVCVLDDAIFMLGGCGKHRIISDSCHYFCTVNATWNVCAPMPEKLYAAACCMHKRHIVIIGTQVHVYDTSENQWMTLESLHLPFTMGFNNAMSHNDHVYLTGKYSNELIRFKLENVERSCSEEYELIGNFKHKPCKSCLIDDCIYIFSNANKMQAVEIYDINENAFKVVATSADPSWSSFNKADFVDFLPEQSSGSFPIIKF